MTPNTCEVELSYDPHSKRIFIVVPVLAASILNITPETKRAYFTSCNDTVALFSVYDPITTEPSVPPSPPSSDVESERDYYKNRFEKEAQHYNKLRAEYASLKDRFNDLQCEVESLHKRLKEFGDCESQINHLKDLVIKAVDRM